MENKETEKQRLLQTLAAWKKEAGHRVPVILHLTAPSEISQSSKRLVLRKVPADRYGVRYHNADNFYKPVSRMI
ncbi:MAG: hypothetical protein WBB45_02235 [Cyclobacteriaceae bacterium]